MIAIRMTDITGLAGGWMDGGMADTDNDRSVKGVKS